MLSAFGMAFKTPDLRKKIFFTLSIMALFRFGSVVPTPGVGTTEPKRNRAMIERVKKIFLRSSGVLNAIPNAESINLLPLAQ